jgi:hypothetical protein
LQPPSVRQADVEPAWVKPCCAQQTWPATGQSVRSSQRTLSALSGQLLTDSIETQRGASLPAEMQQN